MTITTKSELIEYCLRKLGKPVINIEVADSQCEDRIDDALELYYENHYDATEEKWVYYQLTQTDIDAGYIKVPDEYDAVISVVPAAELIAGSGGGMFSYQYQMFAYQLRPWQTFDMIDFYVKSTSIGELNDLLTTTPRHRFIKHTHQLKLYNNYCEGTDLLMRVYERLNKEDVWNDQWLRKYACALIKRQWGENTKKYESVQLLGGITVTGQTIFQEAMEEIQKLEEDLVETYREPVGFIFG